MKEQKIQIFVLQMQNEIIKRWQKIKYSTIEYFTKVKE